MVQDAFDIINTMSLEKFLTFFWFWLVFDLPRYLFSLIPVVIATLTRMWSTEKARSRAQHPTGVSFILAGYNEADSIEETIRSVREQTYAPIEIIVVDDGSDDKMSTVAGEFLKRGMIDRLLSTQIRGGRSAALNLALRDCRYDIVAYGDTDTTYDRDAFANFVPFFGDPRVGAVSPNLGIKNARDSVITRLQAIEFLEAISIGRRFLDLMGMLPIVSGGFGAFRKTALISVGGWEPGTGEDSDVTEKLRRAGWKIRFAPHSWGLTSGPSTLLGLMRQRLRWERDVVRLRLRKFRSNMSPFYRRFDMNNLLSNLDILFFQVIMPFVFIFYILFLFYMFGTFAFTILLTVTIFYFIEDLINYVFVLIFHPERGPWEYFPYIPLLSVYQWLILRLVRSYAYLDEWIFETSLRDSYVPKRVAGRLERF